MSFNDGQSALSSDVSVQTIRAIYDVTIDPGMKFEEKLDSLLAMGCERTGCRVGVVSKIEDAISQLVHVHVHHGGEDTIGVRRQAIASDLCQKALESDGAVIFNPSSGETQTYPGFEGEPPLGAYIGERLEVDRKTFGTLHFCDTQIGDRELGDDDREVINMMAKWIGAEMTRQNREEVHRQEAKTAGMQDELTQLANRALLMDRIERAIHRARRVSDYRFGLLFLDFDRFKIINDSLGHRAGDELLIRIAERLSDNLRKVDSVSRFADGHLAARIGGDEFVVLLDGLADAEDAALVAGRLQETLSQAYNIEGHEVISTASIGIVTSDGDYSSPDAMLRDADTAMYKAKTAGRARHVVFDEQMHEEAVLRLNLEKDLRKALKRSQLFLLYQPIVSLQNGKPLGFEALIRWQHATLGLVSPEVFVPIAEETGLINEIGEWALYEGTQQIKEWQDRFPHDPPFTMNINLSPRQLSSGELVETVRQVIDDVGVAPETIKLEITESMVMDNRKDLSPVLHELRSLGVKLAMDDFGTGHSSLSCLHRFPLDVLKIDREFVWNMDEKREYAAVIQAIVTLAHTLDITVVAEGIENASQLAQLQALECDHAQGYYFARPLDVESVERFLSSSDQKAKSA